MPPEPMELTCQLNMLNALRAYVNVIGVAKVAEAEYKPGTYM